MAGPQPLLSALYTLLTDFLSGNLRKQGLQARPRGHASLGLPWTLQGWGRHCTDVALPPPPLSLSPHTPSWVELYTAAIVLTLTLLTRWSCTRRPSC